MPRDDDYGLEPAKKGGAGTAVADDYGLEKAGGATTATEEAPEPSEENLPGSTARLREAVKSGVAKMPSPTNFEQQNPIGYDFQPHKMEPQEYLGLPSSHMLGAAAKGAKDVIGSTAKAGYDVALGEANPETGELEHGLGGLINLNTRGEYAPVQKLQALGKEMIVDPAKAELEKAGNAPTALEKAGHLGAAAVPLVGPWAASLGERAGSGDVSGAAGEAVGGVLGGELMAHPGETAKAVKDIGGAVTKGALDAAGNPLALGLSPEEKLTKGIRPRARAQGWQEAISNPEVQRSIVDYNAQTPIRSVEDFHDAIGPMKEKLWDEKVQPALDRQGPRPVDMKPAADGIRNAITPEMREFKPQDVAQLEALANQLDKARTVEEASRLQTFANQQLEAYFGKYPTARRSAFATNPETMGWELARRGIREQLMSTLEDAGETETAPARQAYGHLTTLEKELERKVNPNERKAPTSLYHFLGGGAGLITALMGHPGVGALAALYSHLANHFNKPDVLIRSGIKELNPPPPAPFTAPPPYREPIAQFPQGQGALTPQAATAPVQGPAPPPQPFDVHDLRPNRTAMWEQQVGPPPNLTWGGPRAPYHPPIGPEVPAPEPITPPIIGEQIRLPLPEGPKEAPLWNLTNVNRPPELQKLPGVNVPPGPGEAGIEAPRPLEIGGPGREGPLRKIEGEAAPEPLGRGEEFRQMSEDVKGARRAERAGPIQQTHVDDLSVGDTFVDDKGEPRRVVDINDGEIKTADGTKRTYDEVLEHHGPLNNPISEMARGGKFKHQG